MTLKDQCTPRQLFRLLLEWAVGLMGVLGSMLCLSTSFSVPLPDLLYFLVPLAMLLFCFAFRLRQGNLLGAIVGTVFLLLLFFLRKRLFASFSMLWNIMARIYVQGYEDVRDFYSPEKQISFEAAGPALLTVALLETYFTALAVSRFRHVIPAALAMMLGVVPCYILKDTPPKLYALMLVVFSILILVLSQNARRREPREAGRAFLWAAAVSAVLLGVLMLVIPPRKTFQPPVTWKQLSEKIEQWNKKRDNRGNVSAGLSGNPADLDLHGLERLPNKAIDVMEIVTDYEGSLYLRGSSYSKFDGRRWARDKVSAPLRAAFPSVGAPAGKLYNLAIAPLEQDDLYYTAYNPVVLPGKATLSGDAYFKNPEPEEAYLVTFSPETQRSSVLYNSYETYVRSTCLELSEEQRSGLLQWWARNGSGIGGSTAELAERVGARIAQVASYSRDPITVPKGKDFALWFLTEAESGYCVHYATCAAAMLRALGIPARYVSGYICHVKANEPLTVTSLQAHAWVEYYDNGRWRLLEATPGDATEFTGRLPGETETTETETESTAPPETTTAPVTTEAPSEPESASRPEASRPAPTSPKPSGTRPTSPDATGEPETGSESGTAEQTPAPRGFPTWLWYPLGLLALAGLILLRRVLAARLRARRLEKAAGNDKALLLFRRYRRLCRLGKTGLAPEAEVLAKKARFSQHTLDDRELDLLRACMEEQESRLTQAGFWKRLWYRYILAVL